MLPCKGGKSLPVDRVEHISKNFSQFKIKSATLPEEVLYIIRRYTVRSSKASCYFSNMAKQSVIPINTPSE